MCGLKGICHRRVRSRNDPDLRRDDRRLLRRIAAGDDKAFSAFYRAHLNALVAFFRRRVPDPELAFDLAAETFAVVAARADTFHGSGEPVAWLYGIARNKLRESLRRGRVEDEARRALGLPPAGLDDPDLERVEDGLPPIARDDPGACLQARRAKVRELSAKRPVEVRAAAERDVVRMRDTGPGLQTISIDLLGPPGRGGFGVSFRLRPGEVLPAGVVAGDGRLSVGIADPRAVRVRSGSRSARVVDGLYVIAARGRLTELAADGSVIRRTARP